MFEKVSTEIIKIIEVKGELEGIISKIDSSSEQANIYLMEIQEIIKSLEEEFAEIKREINIPNLNPDDFAKFKVEEDNLLTPLLSKLKRKKKQEHNRNRN
ncbi:MAG: hypothetical protein ACLSIL_08690 [Enterococcus casseliflavus]